ncbi:MAG: ribonuclease PH [Anaerolineae bacterium]|nr:ribonuclease PH [Anaerolineae bacterium]
MPRPDGRPNDALRPIRFHLGFIEYAEGSVLIEAGRTRVLCNVTVEGNVPPWLKGQGRGWLTAEYAMLPRSTHTRTPREAGLQSGRTKEIQRLIGRSLRAALNLEHLGERTLIVDCDVIQADGGTRTVAITGGYVAVVLALRSMIEAGTVPPDVLRTPVAAVSAGIVEGEPRLDLCYAEDSVAEVDLNIVMTGNGDFVEIQGTGEGRAFTAEEFQHLLALARKGIEELLAAQARALEAVARTRWPAPEVIAS